MGVIVLPTLRRPKDIERFIKAYQDTEAVTDVWLLVDQEDPALEAYRALQLPPTFSLRITQTRSMGGKLRETYAAYKNKDWVMVLNDDHVPRTPKWDQIIASQMTPCNALFTNDGPNPQSPWNYPKRPCGAITISGGLIRALGWFFPPGLNHFFSDDAWGVVFNAAGCFRTLPDVCIEHVHVFKDESLVDETFKITNGENGLEEIKKTGQATGGYWKEDREAFQKWHNEEAKKDIQKVIDLQPKTGIMIATPFHEPSCSVGYTMSMMNTQLMLAFHNIHMEFCHLTGSSLLSSARNTLVYKFMKSKCQKLLFIDSDQGWDPKMIFNLLNSSRPIICGVTPHKRFPINLNFCPMPEDEKYFKDLCNKSSQEFLVWMQNRGGDKGEIEVAHAGTGIMMIDRSVFETIDPTLPDYVPYDNQTDEKHKEYFRMGVEGGKFLGEDWYFTKLVQKHKIPIYVNGHVQAMHQGTFSFGVGM